MKQPLIFLLLFSLATSISCKKDKLDEFGLPKPTQEGRGTFTAILNGTIWEPCVEPCFLCPPDPEVLSYNYGERNIYLKAQNYCGNNKQAITFYADSIDYENNVYGWWAKFTDFSDNCYDYRLDTTANNYLIITKFDGYIHGIISGEFEFTFYNKDCPLFDTIKVRGGRFDVRTDF
ncbi:MAG: hypothetical protein KDC86_04515 [Saprospiraceae bacterium]|nr:hypothetical protein [Saprospiraceae bacterium]